MMYAAACIGATCLAGCLKSFVTDVRKQMQPLCKFSIYDIDETSPGDIPQAYIETWEPSKCDRFLGLLCCQVINPIERIRWEDANACHLSMNPASNRKSWDIIAPKDNNNWKCMTGLYSQYTDEKFPIGKNESGESTTIKDVNVIRVGKYDEIGNFTGKEIRFDFSDDRKQYVAHYLCILLFKIDRMEDSHREWEKILWRVQSEGTCIIPYSLLRLMYMIIINTPRMVDVSQFRDMIIKAGYTEEQYHRMTNGRAIRKPQNPVQNAATVVKDEPVELQQPEPIMDEELNSAPEGFPAPRSSGQSSKKRLSHAQRADHGYASDLKEQPEGGSEGVPLLRRSIKKD